MSEENCLDLEALARLRRFGKGGQFVREMIDLFLSYAPTKLAEAQKGLEAGDLLAIEKAVHPLKSGAGNIGARVVRDLATQIERLAAAKQGDDLPALLHELDTAFAEVKVRLEAAKQSES
ncbi:MAG TPA: Hpt domain-containing protein [Verrucomicrobiae bacterium]|jgi:HPt (histidine-containing phosphotransfer) domain-containing protein